MTGWTNFTTSPAPERVNRGPGTETGFCSRERERVFSTGLVLVAQEKEFIPKTGAWLYAALISMAVIILILLIVILNMVLRRKLGRGKRELDDMDF